ncbi:TVP38/TMEM64 family protein [Arcobacter sp. LA11]|uniref:TVP38/TMEM64 family protein n=1 Tax=Arcobacter sp. LA11 TaxID=1898176 RepID=UPI00093362D1|nr:TVP38/TMEM64 family protein [Arcobacter sp. LA11]
MKSKIIIVLVFVLIIGLIKFFDLDSYFTFENLKAQKDVLTTFVNENYALTVVIFILTYIVSVAFLIPIATVLTLSGGFLFGALVGTVFVNIGATLGAVAAFLLARYIIGKKVQSKYEKQLEKFNTELENSKYQYLFSLRFLPIFPFFLVNFLCGVTKVDLKTFIITTSLGIIPGSFVYTYAGSQLANINSLGDIFTKDILFAFILLGLLTLVPVIVKKFKNRRKEISNEDIVT